MEFFKILLLLLILSIPGFSQKEKTTVKLYTAKSPQGMKFIPPGECSFDSGEGLEIKSIMGFWMSNEITNKEFREFYEDIKANPDSCFSWVDIKNKDKDGNYKIINIKYSEIFYNLIDISVWKDNTEFENYFTDKAFDNYPITGVNYTSAMYYCWWRSKKENEKNKNKEYLVVYRLALEIEWAYVAYSGTGNNIQGLSPIRPQKVKSGKPNLFGLYNLYGNAAELVSTNDYETAKIMTYSWLNTSPDEVSKTVDRNYRDNVTGFRIVRTFLGIKK